MQDERIVL